MHLSCDVWEAQGAVSKYSEFKSKIPFKKIQTSAATFCFHVTDFHSFIWDVTDFFFVGTFQKKYKKDCLKIIFVGIWKGLLFMQTQCICQLMEMKKMWTSTGEKLSKQQWRGTSDIGLTSEGNMCWSFIFKWKCWYQTRIETRSLLDIVRNVGALLPFIWKKKKSRKKKKAVKGLYGDEKCLWYSDLTGFIGLDLFIYLSFTVVMIIKLAQEVTNHCFHLDLKGFKILWTGSF